MNCFAIKMNVMYNTINVFVTMMIHYCAKKNQFKIINVYLLLHNIVFRL